MVIDADDAAELAGPSRLNAGDRIFDDDRAGRFDLEPPRCFQKSIGRRLAVEREMSDIETVHPRIEELCNAGGLEHCSAVIAQLFDTRVDGLDITHLSLKDRKS